MSKLPSVCGVGIKDVNFCISKKVNGKHLRIPSYVSWASMLERCYTPKQYTSYVGCSVTQEWLKFSAYLEWYTANHIEGYDLDKDIILPGNKVYGPSVCAFVSPKTNTLLLASGRESNLPLGVSRHQKTYRAASAKRYLGVYSDVAQAHKAWQLCKLQDLIYCKLEQTNLKVAEGLQIRIDWLKEAIDNDLETVSLNCKGVSYADSIRSSIYASRGANEGPAREGVAVVEGSSGAYSQAD